ncbi:hypothetical protein SPI_06265 [Niveomyces insectorum RCEF 264]|uniref:F-box domain-containing protein n=1 Tax=Niveomyces insectorum RCEF 264 TaxID=1081102 RepID=A0A167RYM8_9HYPO|nr:hypothetical protein SPI_06265 [Niveomyces insectorum RCEF 264]
MPLGRFAKLPTELRLQILEEFVDEWNHETLKKLRLVDESPEVDSIVFKNIVFIPALTTTKITFVASWRSFLEKSGPCVKSITFIRDKKSTTGDVSLEQWVCAIRAATHLPYLNEIIVRPNVPSNLQVQDVLDSDRFPADMWPLAAAATPQAVLPAVRTLNLDAYQHSIALWADLCPNITCLDFTLSSRVDNQTLETQMSKWRAIETLRCRVSDGYKRGTVEALLSALARAGSPLRCVGFYHNADPPVPAATWASQLGPFRATLKEVVIPQPDEWANVIVLAVLSDLLAPPTVPGPPDLQEVRKYRYDVINALCDAVPSLVKIEFENFICHNDEYLVATKKWQRMGSVIPVVGPTF